MPIFPIPTASELEDDSEDSAGGTIVLLESDEESEDDPDDSDDPEDADESEDDSEE